MCQFKIDTGTLWKYRKTTVEPRFLILRVFADSRSHFNERFQFLGIHQHKFRDEVIKVLVTGVHMRLLKLKKKSYKIQDQNIIFSITQKEGKNGRTKKNKNKQIHLLPLQSILFYRNDGCKHGQTLGIILSEFSDTVVRKSSETVGLKKVKKSNISKKED